MNRISVPQTDDPLASVIDQILAALAGPLGLVLAALAAAALVSLVIVRRSSRAGRWRRAIRRARAVAYRPGTETPQAVGAGPRFVARPILNASERRLHRQLERLVPSHFHPDARLLAQVSLAEFISASSRDDFLPISAQRVDFLIVDPGFLPLCAIEYQGAGHSGADAHAQARTRTRDFTKRTALRMAGVPLIEIPEQWDTALLRDRLGDVTGRREPPARRPPPGPAGQGARA